MGLAKRPTIRSSALTQKAWPISWAALDAAFERIRGDLADALSHCGSGQELIEHGFVCDIELASEYAVSSAVPMLAGDRFAGCAR